MARLKTVRTWQVANWNVPKITKKENDDNKSEDSTKTEGQRTEKV
jgi:hypothetical protein